MPHSGNFRGNPGIGNADEIENAMAFAFELSCNANAKCVTKKGAAIGETVILATLPGRIGAGALDRFDEICSDVAAQPFAFSARLWVDAHDPGEVAARDELAHQRSRRLAPDRLHVTQARAGRALLVPGAHVGEVDVAEGDGFDPERARLRERAGEGLLEALRMRLDLQQCLPERVRLRLDELLAHAVEAHPMRVAFGDVDEVGNFEARARGAVEGEQRILAAAPEERVLQPARSRGTRVVSQWYEPNMSAA